MHSILKLVFVFLCSIGLFGCSSMDTAEFGKKMRYYNDQRQATMLSQNQYSTNVVSLKSSAAKFDETYPQTAEVLNKLCSKGYVVEVFIFNDTRPKTLSSCVRVFVHNDPFGIEKPVMLVGQKVFVDGMLQSWSMQQYQQELRYRTFLRQNALPF